MINKAILKNAYKKEFKEKEIYGAYRLFFGTLVSEPRLKILNLLREEEKSVSEIMNKLKMNQTSVSHNLSRLKKCDFVNVETKGKFRYYKINKKTIKPLMEIIDKHMLHHCIHILREMKGGTKNEKQKR